MAYVVPAVLGGLALAVMALVSSYASRKRSRSLRHPSEISTARVLIHSINDDRCTGCDACVAVCPTNVLDLVENKSRVLHFQDCIQCEACMWACPTTALVMHPEGTEPPDYKMPELDEFYQTAIPGQYLIGEVAGKPLVKNAANLGRGVIEHMLAHGLRPAHQRGLVDVAIVGSGPGGLSAALSCLQRGLSYVLVDKENLIASTIARYPKGKLIMAEPYDTPNYSLLPVFDSSKEEMVPIWQELVQRTGVQVRLNETVETVTRRSDGVFEVKSNAGQYHAQRVVLATGLRGKPRMLGVPGEAQAKVHSLLEDPDEFRGQAVCVVGGGDSALEAAIALADSGAKVVLSYRGRSFARAQQKNKKLAEKYDAERRIKIKYGSQCVEFGPDTVTLEMTDGSRKRYPNQAAFILIGADPPIKWLNKLGIRYVERPHMFSLSASASMVQQFLGQSVLECPPTAELAAMLVRNEELPADVKRMATNHGIIDEAPPQADGEHGPSAPRRFLRAATQMFRGGGKLDKPMPLSEFAKAQRKHSGRGRRDQLDAGERTRILRMLRDDGARQADEESKIFFLEDLGKPESEHQKRPFHFEDEPAPSTLNTYESRSPHQGERTANGPPPAPRGIPEAQPKPAVIVGLARANAEGPRGRKSAPRPSEPVPDLFRLPDDLPDDPKAPSSGAPAGAAPLIDSAPFFRAEPDEATQFADAMDLEGPGHHGLGDADTQLMDADAAIVHDHEPMRSTHRQPASSAPPPPAMSTPHIADFEDEERTMLADFDPQELMRKAAEIDVSRRAAEARAAAGAATASHASAAPSRPSHSAAPRGAVVPARAAPPAPPRAVPARVTPAAPPLARRTKLPPPPARLAPRDAAAETDPNMLFNDDDIDAATAAIDLNLLDEDLVIEDSGATQALDAREFIQVPPPGPDDETSTRVESLSDVDWDLE